MPDEKNNVSVVQAEVDISMKDGLKSRWQLDGFRSEAEALRYIIRQYILNGLPQCRQTPTPEESDTKSRGLVA